MLWFSAAILLAMAAYPFLKLHLSGPAERLRAGDLVVAAIVSCAVALVGLAVATEPSNPL